jgi:hypothetical protein
MSQSREFTLEGVVTDISISQNEEHHLRRDSVRTWEGTVRFTLSPADAPMYGTLLIRQTDRDRYRLGQRVRIVFEPPD